MREHSTNNPMHTQKHTNTLPSVCMQVMIMSYERSIDDPPTTPRFTNMDNIGVIKHEKERIIYTFCFITMKTLLAMFGRETI